ncbi:Nuclear receptor corepressor 1 [Hordeum vulgare]|nr:Nuclear receptor corepressor 1 [Hordeum vulgare]
MRSHCSSIEALNNHGKDFARISSYVKSKSYEQCKVFFSKAHISLGLDLIYQRTTDVGLPTGDANGGTSDTDEACAAEMDSPICSTESPVEMEMEVCPSADKTLQGHPLCGITFKQSETNRSDGPDIVDLTFEEGEIKAEDTKNCNIPVDHRQSIEATHHTPSCAPIDINSSQSTGSMENREHNNQVSVHGNRAMASSTEEHVGAHLEISSSLHNVEVIEPSKASEKICTQHVHGLFLSFVVNFLARRAMTTHHRPAAAPPFPLHSPGSSTGSADSASWSSCCHHRHAPAMPPLLPFDTSDADEKLLLNVLSRHQGASAHKAAAVALPLKQGVADPL